MTHAELVEAAAKWARKQGRPIVASEIVNGGPETPDVIGFGGVGSLLVECKASRSDFLADAKKHFRQHPELGVGTLRYYCAPDGLIASDELPERWGLLDVLDDGTVRRRVRAVHQEAWDARREVGILVSIIRRLNVKTGDGVSIRCYVDDTSKKATVSIDTEDPCAECDIERVVSELNKLAIVAGKTIGLRTVDFDAGEDVPAEPGITDHALWVAMRETIAERDAAIHRFYDWANNPDDAIAVQTQRAIAAEEARDEAKQCAAELTDMWTNGIKWNDEANKFDVVWTKEEIEAGQDKAEEFSQVLGLTPKKTRVELQSENDTLHADLNACKDSCRELLDHEEKYDEQIKQLTKTLAEVRQGRDIAANVIGGLRKQVSDLYSEISKYQKRIELTDRAFIVGAPHDKIEDCPTYWDGCNCTVETLAHNIHRAEWLTKAIAKHKAVQEDPNATSGDRNHADEELYAAPNNIPDVGKVG